MTLFKLHPQLAADTIELGDLPICKVLLMNDSQFPWVILVPRRDGIKELYELEAADLQQAQLESISISKILMEHFKGDKLNVATLGNMVPQLHIHHIVRFKNDVAWPKPVWGNTKPLAYEKSALEALSRSLNALLYLEHRYDCL